jgi:diguanylate cyclase (GGDEF)-like protein/PAS domain S-box-containing protein
VSSFERAPHRPRVGPRLHVELPTSPFARLRLLFLAIAVLSALVLAATLVLTGDAPTAGRLGAALLMLALAAYWVAGYRRGGFAPALEPLEAAALFAGLHFASGTALLPVVGLCFRSLYGDPVGAGIRYLLWMGALLGAHAGRGTDVLNEDLARALGSAVLPAIFQALLFAARSSEASRRRLTSLVQNSCDAIAIVGEDLRVRWQADSIRGVLGLDPDDLVGTPLLELVHPDDRGELEAYFAGAAGHPDHTSSMTVRFGHADGGHRHVEVVATNRLHDRSVAGHVLNLRDATDRQRLEHELRALAEQREHEAMHDGLTGLPNRRRLYDRLGEATARASAEGADLALLLIDLDHFKELNDTLGHHAGDQLLGELGPRLLACVPEAEIVARVGGDEFAVLLPAGVALEHAEFVANRLKRTIELPFRLQGMTLLVRASVGIAMFPEHGHDAETLIQRADIAMYSAKSRGLAHEVYSASRDGHSRARLALLGELPDAIDSGQIVVHYQPKFDLATGRVEGAEALVRWEHPEAGLLGPGAFLPLAEQTGLMRPLTLRVLGAALSQCAGWREQGLDLSVAVNLGAPNLLDFALPRDVAALLAGWDVPPERLKLEITETIVAADPVRVIEIMNLLLEVGVQLSLDDFGTGSSSLAYLRELPVQELKIDKSFVLGMEHDAQAAMIVQTIVELAHNLGLEAVGEGIETEAVHALLRGAGCDLGQGFLMGRPMPAEQLTALVLAGQGASRRGGGAGRASSPGAGSGATA